MLGKKCLNREAHHEWGGAEDRRARGSPAAAPSRSSWLGGPVCARESAPASRVHTEDVPACPRLLRGPVLVGALTPVRGPRPVRREPVQKPSLGGLTCGLVLLTEASCGFMQTPCVQEVRNGAEK